MFLFGEFFLKCLKICRQWENSVFFGCFLLLFFLFFVEMYTYWCLYISVNHIWILYWVLTTHNWTGWIDWLDFTYISLKLRICFCTTRMFTKATGTKMFVFWVYVTAIHPNKTFFHFNMWYILSNWSRVKNPAYL